MAYKTDPVHCNEPRHTNTLKQTETANLKQPTHSHKHTDAYTQNHSRRSLCLVDRVWWHWNQAKGQCLWICSDPSWLMWLPGDTHSKVTKSPSPAQIHWYGHLANHLLPNREPQCDWLIGDMGQSCCILHCTTGLM